MVDLEAESTPSTTTTSSHKPTANPAINSTSRPTTPRSSTTSKQPSTSTTTSGRATTSAHTTSPAPIATAGARPRAQSCLITALAAGVLAALEVF
ncbi:hypothetical protein GQ53DRAFT_682336 [Thozetella sp. PMI_491]|nr:hypothetical protein GQ53DRAFT_682336 [Thozetella sp. PMI_491]